MTIRKRKGVDELAIGNNIKKLVDNQKVSISKFSRDADISYTSAFELYHNKTHRISFDVLDKLCEYFGVGPSELFPYTPEAKKRLA